MAQVDDEGLLSSGEVVLIETRQHWMAAVRYALGRSCSSLWSSVLLASSTTGCDFDDDGLSFINDIVTLDPQSS